jgi:hypothetical protein
MTGEAISRASRGRAQLRLERIRKDDLFFPTDGAALVFGVLIFSLVIFALDKQLLGDPDTYWHVATGKWILTERAFPRRDIFSHTALGQPWIDLEWLAQVILFESYDRFGWAGLILLCGFVISLTFVIMYEFLAAELRPTVALGASAISFLFASDHYLARPHLLTLPIIVVWTVILSRASTEKCSPPLWLLPLMTLWANLHGGFTLGCFWRPGLAWSPHWPPPHLNAGALRSDGRPSGSAPCWPAASPLMATIMPCKPFVCLSLENCCLRSKS